MAKYFDDQLLRDGNLITKEIGTERFQWKPIRIYNLNYYERRNIMKRPSFVPVGFSVMLICLSSVIAADRLNPQHHK